MSIPSQKDADQTLRYAFDDDTNAFRVEGSFTFTNPANGDTGAPVPTQATQVGGEDPSGNLEALQLDASGNLLVSIAAEPGAPFHVIVDSSALPSGAATEAKQDNQITQETAIAGSVASIDSNIIHADTDNVTVVSSSLPTGAATAANQATEIASLASIDSKLTSPITVTGPLTDTQLRASAVPVSAASLPLPTGAATEATSLAIKADLDDLNARLAGGFVPAQFDETVITYVGVSTDIDTVVYKLSGATVATLTMSYDGSDRLIGVVKT